ncbi:MAG TPA: hypothetical protein VHM94_07445 [Acidimicrobiia bacterium]|jgi:hypothetical protein|nr:hypothetical protein [Acidimicrobiia bacterium]
MAAEVVVAALLAALLMVMVAALVWQEAKRRADREPRVYVISEAVAFVRQRLPADIASRLDNAKVQRILEWEVYYLQGLAHTRPQDTIAGGDDEAIDFVIEGIRERNRVVHSREDVAAVLRLEADYLLAIGAVGPAVSDVAPTASSPDTIGRDPRGGEQR